MSEPFRILTIDGGGVFGIIPATFMKGKSVDRVNLLAGTSVGSQMALCLANGMSTEEFYRVFENTVNSVFKSNWFRTKWSVLRGPKYADKALNEGLQKILKGTLIEASKLVVVPSQDMARDKFKVWDNIDPKDDMDTELWEIARMSSAAPTYFAPWKGHIDGGWTTNNPSLIAMIAAMDKLCIDMHDIRLLSVGTGYQSPRCYSPEEMKNWGGVDWLEPLAEGVTKSNEQPTEHMMKILSRHMNWYRRFDPVHLNRNWKMDDPSNLELFKEQLFMYQPVFDELYEEFIS